MGAGQLELNGEPNRNGGSPHSAYNRELQDPRREANPPGHRLAVEHVLGMLAAGDRPETILEGYPWLEPEDIQACLVYAHRLVAHQRIDLTPGGTID